MKMKNVDSFKRNKIAWKKVALKMVTFSVKLREKIAGKVEWIVTWGNVNLHEK